MANQWFRMYADFLDDPKLITLAFEDQRHFIGILACKCAGHLDNGASPVILDRIVAQKLWIDYAIIGDIKKRLVAAGLIDESWQPLGWEKRQFKSDHDLTAGERQRRYREKQRNALHNALSNEPVTRTETDTDTDTETDISSTNVLDVRSDAAEPAAPVADTKKLPSCPHQKVIDLYHESLPYCPQVREWNTTRQKYLQSRWREKAVSLGWQQDAEGLEWFKRFFSFVRESKFLTGKSDGRNGKPPFLADLEWLMRPSNFAKVVEGKYHQ